MRNPTFRTRNRTNESLQIQVHIAIKLEAEAPSRRRIGIHKLDALKIVFSVSTIVVGGGEV